MTGGDTKIRKCPSCGGWNAALRPDGIPEGDRYCTPLSCSSWSFVARLTKDGPKPVRPDGRADLHPVRGSA